MTDDRTSALLRTAPHGGYGIRDIELPHRRTIPAAEREAVEREWALYLARGRKAAEAYRREQERAS